MVDCNPLIECHSFFADVLNRARDQCSSVLYVGRFPRFFKATDDKIAMSRVVMSLESRSLGGVMSTGRKLNMLAAVFVLCLGTVCLGFVTAANADSSRSQHKTKTKKAQKPQPPPLPAGPTGPVQPMPLDSMAPVAPQVSYQNSQLTIVAPNSTLGDILRAVRKQTGAEIEIPPATERVVTHLGPGPAREVIAQLLNGSRFNYVLLGSPADDSVLTRVVLVAKGPQDSTGANNPAIAEQPQAAIGPHTGNPGARLPEPDPNAAADDSTDDAADQAAAEAEQQQQTPSSPDQPAVKTPHQMLQEMQQRQLQLQQQQQQPGQPPPPGAAVPPPQPPQQ
jgi:hypothetical protein